MIELSRDLSAFQVPIDSIGEIDSVYWFDEINEPSVRGVAEHARLIQEVDPSFPIILGSDGRVMDGMHRVARALLEGRTTISAVRFESPVEPDYTNCSPSDLPYD